VTGGQVKDSFGKIEQFYDENENIAWKGPLIVLSSSMGASALEVFVKMIFTDSHCNQAKYVNARM
jgi:C-terminal processing protease CtpA/Prc